MMFPFPLAGLAAAGTALISKYKAGPSANNRQLKLKKPPQKEYRRLVRPTYVHNPLLPILNDLRSKLTEVFKKPEKADYDSIVKNFLPAGAKILTPQFPGSLQNNLIADIDGDTYNEIIASYELRDEIKTLILKQKSNDWYRAAEISHPNHSTLHYRGVAALSDEGKKQLLIGIKSGDDLPLLTGYTFGSGSTLALFARQYHRFEVIDGRNGSSNPDKQQLAIWERDSSDSYQIGVHSLKDNQLSEDDNIDFYYRTSVVPFYMGNIRRSPYDTGNWYNLANALMKIKAVNDAEIAIKFGSELDKDSKFKERFEDLRNRIK